MDKRMGSGDGGRRMLVRLPVELHRAVKRRAAENDATMDDVVVGILATEFGLPVDAGKDTPINEQGQGESRRTSMKTWGDEKSRDARTTRGNLGGGTRP